MTEEEMLQKIESDLEMLGFSVAKIDDKSYLYLRMTNMLATDMEDLIKQNNIYKIIFR